MNVEIAHGLREPRLPWWLEEANGSTFLMTSLGAFSVFSAEQVFTGCGWDAQAAVSFFRWTPPAAVLLLGLGGGTVARQYRMLYPRARIVAIERDGEVIAVARRRFGIDALGIEVIEGLAEDYIARPSPHFDVIVDDAWPFERPDLRSACADPSWPGRLKRRLRRGGLLAINVYAAHHDLATARLATRLRRLCRCTREVGLPGRLTTVLAAGDALRDGRQARSGCGAWSAQARGQLNALRFRSL